MAERSAGAAQVLVALRACSDPEKAAFLPRFFRTGRAGASTAPAIVSSG